MRFLFGLLLLAPALGAEVCAPAARLGPNDTITGAFDEFNCRTLAGIAYTEYSLTLPVQGQVALDAASDAFAPSLVLRDAAGHALASGATIRTPAESGVYSVVVSAAAAGQTGAFTLRAGFTPDAYAYCRQSASVGLDETLTGRLAGGSCRLPDGSAYDAYQLPARGAGTLDISLQSSDFTPYLIVRGEDGHELAASAEGRISQSIAADQRYTVVASGSGTGAYTLKLAFTPADGEACRPAKVLTAPGEDAGRIVPTGCATTDAATGGRIYYNYYSIQVSEPGVSEIRLATSSFDPSIYLLDESGSAIASDSWTAGRGVAMLKQHLRPGRYTLLAFSSVSTPADYTLQYTFSPGPPASCPAVALDSGGVRQGSLAAASSCRVKEGVSDLYEVRTATAGTLEFAMFSNDFTSLLALRDAGENRVVADEYGNGSLAADLPAGRYSLVAATADGPGTYAVAYRFTPGALPACPAPARLDAGYVGQLSGSSCRSATGQPADYYEFTTPADGTTALTLSSGYLYGHLSLLDSQGKPLRENENGLGDGSALVVQYLPAGTYRAAVRGADGTPTGYYQVMRYFSAGSAGGCQPQRTLASGDTLDGRLNFTGCQFPDQTFADLYRFELLEASEVQLGMDSTDFDAYLLVLDAKGNVLAEDDDGDAPTNARVTAILKPGSYLAVAKSYAGYSAGSYRLSFTAKPAALPGSAIDNSPAR